MKPDPRGRVGLRLHLGALAASLLTACAAGGDRARPLTDEALSAALLGAWCNSSDGGRTCWAYDVFRADGTLRACGRFPDETEAFDGTGVVSIAGNVMCYRVLEATDTFWVRPGSRYCTRILTISPGAHTYQDMDAGTVHRLVRVPVDVARCPSDPAGPR